MLGSRGVTLVAFDTVVAWQKKCLSFDANFSRIFFAVVTTKPVNGSFRKFFCAAEISGTRTLILGPKILSWGVSDSSKVGFIEKVNQA